ncbi:MAG: hypothetical protein QMD00_05410 [Hadesarchaea archaeon]|nr:hypothetical protein [Hadesarchaea archaeon]
MSPERKVTVTREELREMYWGQRKSLARIARLYGVIHQSVRYWMIKHGIPRRNRYDATIKYPRTPFSGDRYERAYLLGLRAGDIHARRRATNTIGVNVSTTSPAMIKLMEDTFGRYGRVNKYPAKGPLVYEWYIYCDLDTSFDFLIEKPTGVPDWGDFYAFLAGYVDSEGTITFDYTGSLRPNFWIKSQDVELLGKIRWKLKNDGFHPSNLHLRTKSGTWTSRISRLNGASISIQNTRDYYQLSLHRRSEIAKLVKKLIQFSRHGEKVERMRLALKTTEKQLTEEEARNFIQNANREKEECIKAAEVMYTQKHCGAILPREDVATQLERSKTCARPRGGECCYTNRTG